MPDEPMTQTGRRGEVWASLGVRNNMIRRVLSLQLVRTVSWSVVLLRDTELQLGTWQKDAWFVFLVCKP